MSSDMLRRMRQARRHRDQMRRIRKAKAAAESLLENFDKAAVPVPVPETPQSPVALERDIKVKRNQIDLFLPGNPS